VMDKSPMGVRCGATRIMSKRGVWRSVTFTEFEELKRGLVSGAKRPRTCFNNCTPAKNEIAVWAGWVTEKMNDTEESRDAAGYLKDHNHETINRSDKGLHQLID